LEENVVDDSLGILDESSTLTEVGEEETWVDEASVGKSNRVFVELTETEKEVAC